MLHLCTMCVLLNHTHKLWSNAPEEEPSKSLFPSANIDSLQLFRAHEDTTHTPKKIPKRPNKAQREQTPGIYSWCLSSMP